MQLDPAALETLRHVSTATITTVLLKKGLRRLWMRGPMPLATAAGKRIVGRAFTLRFVPAREDLATPESWSSPRSTRAAIEEMCGSSTRTSCFFKAIVIHHFGASGRPRTDDLRITGALLCQLSYTGIVPMEPRIGIEPTTPSLPRTCSTN